MPEETMHRTTKRREQLLIFSAGLIVALAAQAGTNESPLMAAIEAETGRAFKAFEKCTPPLYFLACGVTDVESLRVGASFGALTFDQHDRRRIVDLDTRCGSYARDNTHPLPGHTWDYREDRTEMPLDDDPTAIRMALWRAIDSEYHKSAERFAQVRALDITKAALRD